MFAWVAFVTAVAGPYDVITRSSASTGIMQVGSLYHAGTEQAVPGRICDPRVVEANTHVQTEGTVLIDFALEDAFSKKMELLDIDGSVAIKVNAAMAQGSNSFGSEFFSDKRSSTRQVRSIFKTEVQTESEAFDVFAPEVIMSAWASSAHVMKLATHVVTGVMWGQRNLGVFQSTVESHVDLKRVREEMLEEVAALGQGGRELTNATLVVSENATRTSSSVQHVKLFSDYVPAKYPSSREEMIDTINTAVESLSAAGARGVPLKYTLTPLAIVTPRAQAQLVWDITASFVLKAQQILDELEESDTLLRELGEIEDSGHRMWSIALAQYRQAFSGWRAGYVQRLERAMTLARLNQRVLPTGRRAAEGTLDWEELFFEYLRGGYSSEKVSAHARDLRAEIEKYMSYIEELRKRGVKIVSSGAQIKVAAETTDTEAGGAYLLLLVDSGHREDVRTVKAFANYAALRRDGCISSALVDDGDNGQRRTCHAALAMLAVHFDSHCSSLCPSAFCPQQSDPSGRRACRTVLAADGLRSHEGECHVGDVAMKTENCWRRPRADDNATVSRTSGNEVLTGLENVITREWCSCPYTMAVDLKAGAQIHLPTLPLPPAIVGHTIENTASPDPKDLMLTLAVERRDPDMGSTAMPAERYRVTVLHEAMAGTFADVTGQEFYHVVTEFDTLDANETIPVSGLHAGRRYTFRVASVSALGAGEASPVYPARDAQPNAVQISAIDTTVSFLGVLGEASCGEMARYTGVEEGMLPSWALPGVASVTIRVATTAQVPHPVDAVEFADESSGRTFACEGVVPDAFSGARCSVPMASLVSDLSEDKRLRVVLQSATGAAMANGTVLLLAPSARGCSMFETVSRRLLCEARILSVAYVPGRHDPLNQAVAMNMYVASYPRGVEFQGWQIKAIADDGTTLIQERRSTTGVATLRMGGLRAGQTYRFYLGARAADGSVSETCIAVPSEGYTVGDVMPIAVHGDGARNHVPGWRSYGHGRFVLDVELTMPAATVIDAVVFSTKAGDAVLECDVHAATTARAKAVVPLGRLNAGGVPGAFGQEVGVSVFDISGMLLAEGTVVREAISSTACLRWTPRTPLHCFVENRVSQCVSSCSACPSTHQVGSECLVSPCGGSELLCLEAADPGERCVPSCGLCPDSVRRTVNGEALCVPPCEPIAGVAVPPGETQALECPFSTYYVDGTPDDPVMFECPTHNADRYPTHPGSGRLAAWAGGLEAPRCSVCSAELHCNGRASSVSPNEKRNGCECACIRGYAGPACSECAPRFARMDDGTCKRDS